MVFYNMGVARKLSINEGLLRRWTKDEGMITSMPSGSKRADKHSHLPAGIIQCVLIYLYAVFTFVAHELNLQKTSPEIPFSF
jgi:hypothetical protein